MTVIPETTVDDIILGPSTVLLLPGADRWNRPTHITVIKKAAERSGQQRHLQKRDYWTREYIQATVLRVYYKEELNCRDVKSMADGNLVPASLAGGLLFARTLLAQLDVFYDDTLKAWYHYFHTGDAAYFYALLQILEK